MSPSRSYRSSVHVDLARSFICREIARALEGNEGHEVRFRVHRNEQPDHVWVYARRKNAWVQLNSIDEQELSGEVDYQLEVLAERGKTDELSVRRQTKPDYDETDLQFDPDWLNRNSTGSLASRLAVVLFRESHTSHKDGRQRIRTPRPGEHKP